MILVLSFIVLPLFVILDLTYAEQRYRSSGWMILILSPTG
jgi:hypothetical protein